MLDTPVSVLARTRPVRVQRNTPLRDAAHLLRQERTRCLAVMDGDALVGIFTDQDMLQKCFSKAVSGDTEVGLVMNSPVISVTPDSSIHDALELIDHERMRPSAPGRARRHPARHHPRARHPQLPGRIDARSRAQSAARALLPQQPGGWLMTRHPLLPATPRAATPSGSLAGSA